MTTSVMTARISMMVEGYGHVELWYDDSGTLNQVKGEGKSLLISLSMSGNGVHVGERNVFGGRDVTGAMVAIPELNIMVPYRIWAVNPFADVKVNPKDYPEKDYPDVRTEAVPF